jgi:hypothetical protein
MEQQFELQKNNWNNNWRNKKENSEQQLEQRLVLQRREFERQLELQKRAQLFIPSHRLKLSAKKEDSFNDEEPSSTSPNDEYSSNDEEPSSSSDIEELIPAPQIEDTPPLEPSSYKQRGRNTYFHIYHHLQKGFI